MKPPKRVSPRNESKVDLKMLSQHLGLSHTTISLVLNDAPHAQRLSPATRDRVRKAAEEFGYKPNYFARSLSGKRSKMVGVLAPDFGEGYDSLVLSGIERCLLRNGYMYFVSSHLWSEDVLRRSLDALQERGAEGLLLLNTPYHPSRRLPAVSVGSALGVTDVPAVTIDNDHGMRLTFQHLVGLGHTKFAVLKGHEYSADTEFRWEATMRVAEECGVHLDSRLVAQLERIDMEATGSIEEGYLCAETLLRKRIPFTALICFNDMSACGAMNAVRDFGLRVPEDVSVMGFDDISLAKVVYPALTTIRQPLQEMGQLAAERLIALIEKSSIPANSLCVQPVLVVRASTAPAMRSASVRVKVAKTAVAGKPKTTERHSPRAYAP